MNQQTNSNLRMLHWTPALLHSTWRILYLLTYTVFWLDNGGTALGVQQFIALLLPAAVHTYTVVHGVTIIGTNTTFLGASWTIALLVMGLLFASMRVLMFQVTSGYYEAVDKNLTDKGVHGPNIAHNPMSKFATAGAVLLTGQGVLTLAISYATDVFCLYTIFVKAGMNDDAHGATLISKSLDVIIMIFTPLFTMFWTLFGPVIVAHIAEHFGDVTYRLKVQRHLITKHMKDTLKLGESVIQEIEDASQVHMVPKVVPYLSQHAVTAKPATPKP